MDARVRAIVEGLQRSGFAELKGLRASARVPLAEPLLNELIRGNLPANGAVRELRVRPQAGNRFDVLLKLARPAFLPPLSITGVIEQQPDFPAAPFVVIRLSTLPGIMSLAGGAAAFFNVLPPGLRLEGDRLLVNIAELARTHGRTDVLGLIRRLNVETEEGAVVLDLDVAI